MRLIGTIKNAKHGRAFSQYLATLEIANQCEVESERDWGSDNYGDEMCHIWVVDEDDLKKAHEELTAFLANPDDEKYYTVPPPTVPPLADKDEVILSNTPPPQPKATTRPQMMVQRAFLTFYTVMLCSLLFLASSMTARRVDQLPAYLPPIAVISGPVLQELLFDFPKSYAIADQLVRLYGLDTLAEPDTLPEEGKTLLAKFRRTGDWQGIYPALVRGAPVVETFRESTPLLMEKIRAGEWWRLFTPCLLHADIFHILFNMLWLIVLGQQMEPRLGKIRYLLFFLITGAISNTAQYLMSGPAFLGFSGIVCAMLGFIWMRQRHAPWEGYQVQRSTFLFITMFVLVMLAIQVGAFALQRLGEMTLPIGIANTAHIVGALVGMVLGKMRFFALRG